MTAIDPAAMPEKNATIAVTLARLGPLISICEPWFRVLGLAWLAPLGRLVANEDPRTQLRELWRLAVVPMLSIAAFLALWATLAPMVQTSRGAVPGPAQVWQQVGVLHQAAVEEGAKADAFYLAQADKNAALVAAGKPGEVKNHIYTGKPTYYRQILTSIVTVFTGFLLATLVAVPLGILAGLSPTANAAINPLVQVFKPVSPLAWLPIVNGGDGVVGDEWRVAEKLCDFGRDSDPVFAVADADQYFAWRGQYRQGSGQRVESAETFDLDQDHAVGVAVSPPADLYRFAPVVGRGLDGADRGGNAGAEPGAWQIRLG